MSNKNVPIMIAFEGVDKSGKTTLIREFNKATNFKYFVLDRFIISSLVYDKLFARGREKYYKKMIKKLKKANVIVVFCNCSESLVRKRLEDANEVLPKELNDINLVEDMFIELIAEYESFFKGTISVCTNSSIESCVNRIVDGVENIERKMRCE